MLQRSKLHYMWFPTIARLVTVERLLNESLTPSLAIAMAGPISRLDTFTTDGLLFTSARYSSSLDSSPILTRPWTMPMVAGTAPVLRTMLSTDRAVCRLTGCGIPWVTIVVSSATTGFRDASASCTSGCTSTGAIFRRASRDGKDAYDRGEPTDLYRALAL